MPTTEKNPTGSTAKITLFVLTALAIIAGPGCFNRRRFNNFNWQLDSLRFYTQQTDSMLELQAREVAQLRSDYYQKSDELGEKLEMLNTRLGEMEMQLTQLNEKFSKRTRTPVDSEEVALLSPEARTLYESAYLNYVKGNYTEAVAGFRQYLKTAPGSPLADNAVYWIGESLAALGKRQDAVDTFNELYAKYPESNRRPTALYKIGIIYEEAKDLKTARMYFEKLIAEFPNSPEAGLARSHM